MPQQLQAYISTAIPCDYIRVLGDDGTHFEAIIVSANFAGKSMVKRHQQVYAALGERMGRDIHALSMLTYTPEEWAERKLTK